MALFAVIGLGSFGEAVALELTNLNHDVIGIDTLKKNVENIADQISHAVIADATDAKAASGATAAPILAHPRAII